MKLPISAVILTRNEEKNIENCLKSICEWIGEIFIVDSGSADRTIEIARKYTDKIYCHPFETHTKQWDWAFKNLPLSNEWCFALESDQAVSGPLLKELEATFKDPPSGINGYYVNRRQIFRGKWIRFGGYYPKYMLKLFKVKDALCDERDLVDHRFYVKGKVATLSAYIIEDNKNEYDIIFWLEKHLRYARLSAEELTSYRKKRGQWLVRPSLWGSYDQRAIWLKEAYYSLPLYIRPFLFFFWRYFILLGFLDGKNGFLFHFLQSFWYRLILDVRIEELTGGGQNNK